MQFIAITLILLMLLIPLPSIALEILWVIELLFAIVILLGDFAGRTKDRFSALLLCFSLFSLTLNIALLRFGLSSILRQYEGISLICWFEEKAIGENYLLALIISLPLIIAVLLVSKASYIISEVSARFALDSMNTKFFEIDNRLHEKEISEEEAERQKKLVQQEVDSKSRLAGAAIFLSGCVKAIVIFLILHLVIGVLLGIFANDYAFFDSIKATAPSFCVNSILFTIPQIITGTVSLCKEKLNL